MIFKAVVVLVVAYTMPGDPDERERAFSDPVPNAPSYSTMGECRDNLTDKKLGAAIWNRVVGHAEEQLPEGSRFKRLAVHVRCGKFAE